MEAVLRPLGMTVTHYAVLELLAQRSGLSNSELARGAFVSRQSMNVLLQSLERDGVTRPAEAAVDTSPPMILTPLRPTSAGDGDCGSEGDGAQDAVLAGLDRTPVRFFELDLAEEFSVRPRHPRYRASATRRQG